MWLRNFRRVKIFSRGVEIFSGMLILFYALRLMKCYVGMLYESIVIPAITYNLEVITNLSAKEMEEIERLQKIALTELFQLPGSAPYWGILNETGMWTLKCRIIYKRLMLHLIIGAIVHLLRIMDPIAEKQSLFW